MEGAVKKNIDDLFPELTMKQLKALKRKKFGLVLKRIRFYILCSSPVYFILLFISTYQWVG